MKIPKRNSIFVLLLLFSFNSNVVKCYYEKFSNPNSDTIYLNFEDYFFELRSLLSAILLSTKIDCCFAIITDKIHQELFTKNFFDEVTFPTSSREKSYVIFRLSESEDLLAPNYKTLKFLKLIKISNCNLILVLSKNGIQMKRFLLFLESHHVLDMGKKFVFFYDHNILSSDLQYVWKKLLNVIFIRNHSPFSGFELITTSYPYSGADIFVGKKVLEWKSRTRKRIKIDLFPDKINNLKGVILNTVVQNHVPMVIRGDSEDQKFTGIEIEILTTLAKFMNFRMAIYESSDSEIDQKRQKMLNGSYTGLLGEMVNHEADIGVGDLHLTEFHLGLFDMSIPHSGDCLTFLTPESIADNTWKTLISPFSSNMWAGVLISFVLIGNVFYIISEFQSIIRSRFGLKSMLKTSVRCLRFQSCRKIEKPEAIETLKQFTKHRRRYKKSRRLKSAVTIDKKIDVYSSFSNCILSTYSMLLLVSLPKMPSSWSLRVLTGWYWIYCILLAVIYRASFTAILANPPSKITIDSLKELAESDLTVAVWGNQNRKFFEEAFDQEAQLIGLKLKEISTFNGTIEEITAGKYAYYDNAYFLRHLRIQNITANNNLLHIMKECTINMPIAIALGKNSPLKTSVDKYLRRMIEGGFLSKWTKSYTENVPAEEEPPAEAIMNLKKFWSSFVAIAIGYTFSSFALVCEILYFKYIVEKSPLFDPYNKWVYFEYMKRK